MAAAAEPGGHEFGAILNDVAVAYRLTTDNPALVDLMSGSRYLANASELLVSAGR